MNTSSVEAAATAPQQNHLLAALPARDFALLQQFLIPVHLSTGEVLCETGSQLRHVFFPTTAIVTKLHRLTSGASTEIAVVGNEGVIGFSLFMGGGTTLSRAEVQSAGYAYRLKSQRLLEAFNRGGALPQLLLRHMLALLTQIAQTAVCNRHHFLEQQLSRLLLMRLDRLPVNELVMTHEMIANLLGVRREGVTEAAGKLQRAGLIHYSRGHITVLNRAGLEAQTCECYAVIKNDYERLLPEPLSLNAILPAKPMRMPIAAPPPLTAALRTAACS